MKKLSFLLLASCMVMLFSCNKKYTCPTYMKNNDLEKQELKVKSNYKEVQQKG